MSSPVPTVEKTAIPAKFSGRNGAKICLTFSDLLAQSEIQMALEMLNEHPWMVLRQAPPSKQLPLQFQSRPYLHIAVMLGSMPLLDAMLNNGASLNEFDSKKRSAIFYAVQDAVGVDLDSERMAHALIQRGARCDGLTKEGDSLVYIKQGQISDDLFHALVKRGAPLSLRKEGTSLLTKMLQSAYDLNANTTVLAAIAETQLCRCKLRITAGADANMHSGQCDTHALNVALQYGDTNMADFLVAHGANPRLVDDHRNTFLHTTKSNAAAVRWLVDHGVDLEARNAWGETPLIYATRNIARANGPNYDHVIALMVAGANLDASDHQGHGVSSTPREWLTLEAGEAKEALAYQHLMHTVRAIDARQTAHKLLNEIAEQSVKAKP